MQTQTPNQVAFHLLRASPRNVRKGKHDQSALAQLAASIAAEGLLQSLVVTEHKNGRGIHYEVEAGARRLAAINLLVDQGAWKKTTPVAVKVIPIEQATSASLAENTVRVEMEPLQQYRAFGQLVAEGKTAEEVAARFGVTPAVVTRRLKLANVAEPILEEFGKGNLTLDALMAFAITEDHEAQLAVWKGLNSWQRKDERAIRAALTADELSVKRDRVAKFVGRKAYEKAGGPVRNDFFSAEGECYLQDVALVTQLANEKLAKAAEKVRTEEAWGWAEALLSFDNSESSRYGAMKPGKREATKAEEKALKKLNDEHAKLESKDELNDEESDRLDELHDLIADAEDALLEYGPKQKGKAGVVVTINHAGKLDIRRGLIRPEDIKAAKKAKKSGKVSDDDGESTPEKTDRDYSADLTRSLSARFTSALQAQLATKPQVALALAVGALLEESRFSRGDLMQLRVDEPRLASYAADIEQGPAAKALEDTSDAIAKSIPGENALAFLIEQPVGTLLEWFAVLVAPAINAVTADGTLTNDAQVAARAAGLDLAKWWKPNGENFFKRVSKGQLVEAVREGAPGPLAEEIARLPRKSEMVARVEVALKDSAWIPPFLRT